jgi:hypothetical protein
MSTQGAIYELWVDVDFNERPVATATAPTGTVTATTRPTVTWNYSDPEGDPQEAFEVRVYTPPAGGWTSASPGGGGTLVWSSGVVLSEPARSRPVGVDLANGEHRAYVRARQSWPTNDHWSLWTHVTWQQAAQAPTPPTLAVVVDADGGFVRATVQATNGNSTPTDSIRVQHSHDGGITWRTVRGGGAVPSGGHVDDYEALPNRPTRYRAFAQREEQGNLLTSLHLASQAITLPVERRWLKDLTDPTRNWQPGITDAAGQIPRRDTVARPLGRRTAVVMSGRPGGTDDRVAFRALGDAEFARVDAFLRSTRTWLLQSAQGEHRYVRVAGDAQWSQPDWDGMRHRTATVALVEVDRPAEDA